MAYPNDKSTHIQEQMENSEIQGHAEPSENNVPDAGQTSRARARDHFSLE